MTLSWVIFFGLRTLNGSFLTTACIYLSVKPSQFHSPTANDLNFSGIC